ncbi:hypothetical protein QAD02_020992 [Eretmocerus hayati]|uniref:Uncharacterized protein n=1 Tax=Eretmocerus hayati TaxID=131215 RepID=A0ACC2PPG8_9HYME|nr:hypothetical protein QAD02_020992 [Eretmocerus hayati]
MSGAQKGVYDELLGVIRNDGPPAMEADLKKQSDNQKIGPKAKMRKVKLVWKHRNLDTGNFDRLQPYGTQTIEVSSSSKLSALDMKKMAIDKFSDHLTYNYFNPAYTKIELATSGNIPFEKFGTVSGKDCFEEFAAKEIDEKHRIELHLLTTRLPEVQTVPKPIPKSDGPSGKSSPEKKGTGKENFKSKPKVNFASPTKSRPISVIENVNSPSKDTYNDLHLDRMYPDESPEFPIGAAAKPKIEIPKIDNFNAQPKAENPKVADDILFKIPSNKRQKIMEMEKLKCQSLTHIPINDLVLSDDVLGKGSFGEVRSGKWFHLDVAMKCMDLSRTSMKSFEKEVSTMLALRHTNVVMLLGISYDEKQLYIVMERIKGPDLRKMIYNKEIRKKWSLTNSQKLDLIKQGFGVLHYLHSHKIYHRDIKPGNILLTDTLILKLCDLGLAKTRRRLFSHIESTNGKPRPIGTLMYMSPEVLLSMFPFTEESDVWSMACVAYELLQHKYTFPLSEDNDDPDDDWQEMENKFREGVLPDLTEIVKPIRDSLGKCFFYKTPSGNTIRFNLTQEKRPTAIEVLNDLPSEWPKLA